MNKHCVMALLIAAAAAGPATAIVVKDGAAPAADAVRQPAAAAPAVSAADDSSSLREGVVSEVGAKLERVKVNGVWLRITPATKVFRQGQPIRAADLAKGQLVKFTLAGKGGERDALGVVYVP